MDLEDTESTDEMTRFFANGLTDDQMAEIDDILEAANDQDGKELTKEDFLKMVDFYGKATAVLQETFEDYIQASNTVLTMMADHIRAIEHRDATSE